MPRAGARVASLAVNTSLPDAGLAAWWCTSWLRGLAPADLLLDAVVGLRVEGGWLDLLVEVRRAGGTGAGLAMPIDGDPVGLGGPAAFNTRVLAAGSALIFPEVGLGLVPECRDQGVNSPARPIAWQRATAAPRQIDDLGEADRALRSAWSSTAAALADLEVGRWRPELADELIDLRRPALDAPPPGVPPRCAQLAAGATRALRIVDLALEDDGAAVSAAQIQQRRVALAPLERAGRRALVAACSADAWPPGQF